MSGGEAKLDMLGEFCPRPIIELAKLIRALGPGDRVELWADDPAVEGDVVAWCKATGHRLIETERKEKVRVFQIEKT